MGPREHNNTNAPIPPDDRRNILQSEMNNPAIEPVAKKYAELRYQLLPYTYTLAWEARDSGLPLMRAMWLHYPDDVRARGLGTQFMWGRDLLVAPVFTKGATSREVYLPKGDWYDWWTNEKAGGRPDRDASGRSRHHAAVCPRRRDRAVRSGAAVHRAAGHGADDAQDLRRRRRRVHALCGRRDQPGVRRRRAAPGSG